MLIRISLLIALLSFMLINVACQAKEASFIKELSILTASKGKIYNDKRRKFLSEKDNLLSLNEYNVVNENEIVQKKILLLWAKNAVVYGNVLNSFEGYEFISKNAVRPYKPIPLTFAKDWLAQHGNVLTPLAIEVVWKQTDWPEWRILAMIEVLKIHAEEDMLAPIVDRLETENNNNICKSIIQLLEAKGGTATIECLKVLVEKKKDDAQVMLDCAKTIQERLDKGKQPDIR